jgi:hypothetical protein
MMIYHFKTLKIKNMKKIKLILGFIALFTIKLNAQTDSVYIVEEKDQMTDKVYYYASRQIICVNPIDKKQGFGVSFFVEKEDDELKAKELKTKIVGIGSCHENDEIIFLLENQTKINAKMWNDFNCDGKGWFKISDSDKELLATNKVLKIRIQNGRTYENYTHDVEKKNQDYFIQLFFAINNNKIKNFK